MISTMYIKDIRLYLNKTTFLRLPARIETLLPGLYTVHTESGKERKDCLNDDSSISKRAQRT